MDAVWLSRKVTVHEKLTPLGTQFGYADWHPLGAARSYCAKTVERV